MTEKISLWVPCFPPGSHGNLSKSNWWPSKWQGNHPGLSGPLNLTLITDKRWWGISPHILYPYSKCSFQNWERCSSQRASTCCYIHTFQTNLFYCFNTFLSKNHICIFRLAPETSHLKHRVSQVDIVFCCLKCMKTWHLTTVSL